MAILLLHIFNVASSVPSTNHSAQRKIDPTKIGFPDLPQETIDFIYSLALPVSEVLSINNDYSLIDKRRGETTEISIITSIKLYASWRHIAKPSKVCSNLVFINKAVNSKILSIFFHSNIIEFRGRSNIECNRRIDESASRHQI